MKKVPDQVRDSKGYTPPDTQKSYPRHLPLPVYFLRACSHGLSGGPSLGREQAGLVWGGGVTIRAPDKDPGETAAGSCRCALNNASDCGGLVTESEVRLSFQPAQNELQIQKMTIKHMFLLWFSNLKIATGDAD